MQFKRQGNKIQVLAYRGYDKEKSRAIVKMLGSLDICTFNPSDGLKNNMTVDEKIELQSYIEKELQSAEKNRLLYYCETADSRISAVTEAIQSDTFEIDEAWAEKVWSAMENLSKAIRKAGFPRKKTPKKSKETTAQGILS